MNKKLLLKTLQNTTLAVAYIFLVSQIMQNGDKWFGSNSSFAPFVILLLFSLSAAIVGGLVLGYTVILFLDNKKKEAVQSAIYSVLWLGLYTIVGMTILFILH